MTLKALRTQAALYLAPWLKPKGREWTISGPIAAKVQERFSEDELLQFAQRAREEGFPIAASGIMERVQALRDSGRGVEARRSV